jgi:hypothetical protein
MMKPQEATHSSRHSYIIRHSIESRQIEDEKNLWRQHHNIIHYQDSFQIIRIVVIESACCLPTVLSIRTVAYKKYNAKMVLSFRGAPLEH